MHKSIRLVAVFLMFALAIGGSISSRPAVAAVGGPVIIGGEDLTDHGSISGGILKNGWLYIRKALENIAPNVTRANDGSVAAIGTAPSTSTSGDAGAAIGRAAPQAGLTVTYHDGATAIDTFFTALAAGAAKPKIIWISGTGAWNDLDGAEITALNSHATKIADFVNSGGGLMSHGSEYGWLFALLPGLTSVGGGATTGDLQLTAAGTSAFPGVTDADIGAGPWHNRFEGNFGGLQILATSKTVLDSITKEPAAVLIGGAAVVLPSAITLTPGSATNPVGTNHTVTATVRDTAGAPLAQVTVTFRVTAGPNLGANGTGVTNASGQATFTYGGNGGPGTDTIEASFIDTTAEARRADTASKTWTGATPPTVSRTTLTASSPACGRILVEATGVTPGLPHQIVVTLSTGGPLQLVNVTADASGKVNATVSTSAGSYFAYVRMTSNQVTVSNTAMVTVAACATPAPTPTPTPTPTPAAIGRLPSTATGDSPAAGSALVLLGLLALGAIAWRRRVTRT